MTRHYLNFSDYHNLWGKWTRLGLEDNAKKTMHRIQERCQINIQQALNAFLVRLEKQRLQCAYHWHAHMWCGGHINADPHSTRWLEDYTEALSLPPTPTSCCTYPSKFTFPLCPCFLSTCENKLLDKWTEFSTTQSSSKHCKSNQKLYTSFQSF